MIEGSAIMGLLFLVGAYLVYGWPAACLGLLLVASWVEPMIYRGIGGLWRRSRNGGSFRYLEPLEQALRRASQGFALMVLAVLAAIAPHFWLHSLGRLMPVWVQLWLAVVCGALVLAGRVRLREGFRNSAGARSDILWSTAALRLGVGGVALGYLVLLDLPAYLSPALRAALASAGLPARFAPVLLDVIAAAVFGGVLWLALVGLARVLLLSWPHVGAEDESDRHIDRIRFDWERF